MLDLPALIVNFKTYEKASGKQALDLAYTCERVAGETGREIGIAVQNADLGRIAPKVEIPVYAQHADNAGYGSNTGKDIVPTLKYNGADGVIINHSEDQASLDEIEGVIKACREHSITSLVCVDDASLASTVADKKPDMVAYEPPELIGGDTSVSTAKPEVLREVVESVPKKLPVLTGAGVKTAKDVETALDLGSEGILVASGVVKADDPAEALRDLTSPF